MYYLIDLAQNTYQPYNTKLALLTALVQNSCDPFPRAALWKVMTSRVSVPDMFQELNITGKDTRVSFTARPHAKDPTILVYTREAYTRRYQVQDEDGRSVDVREWEDEIRLLRSGVCEYTTWHRYYSQRVSGRKRHAHRTGCAAMWRGSMRAWMSVEDEDWKDDYQPVRNRSRARQRGMNPSTSWDACEDKAAAKYACSKCWKDQTKAGRQWAKHKPGCTGKLLRAACAVNDDLEAS